MYQDDIKKLKVCDFEELPGPKSKEELDEMKAPFEEYCRKAFDVGNEFGKPDAMKGIRWMSTTMYIFTPHSVTNIAEMGAECIKIEMPRMGDAMRHTSPFNEAYLYPLHDTRPMSGTGLGYTNANANKYGNANANKDPKTNNNYNANTNNDCDANTNCDANTVSVTKFICVSIYRTYFRFIINWVLHVFKRV